MNQDDVHSISYALGGRDAPCGDVYIKVRDISWIDGKFVSVSNTTFYCADSGIEKILSALEVID